jgi:hypothetical protein
MAKPLARAAGVLGYSAADWYTLSPREKRDLRNAVRNADRRVTNFAKRPASKRKGDFRPDDWSTVEWEIYMEEMGLL